MGTAPETDVLSQLTRAFRLEGALNGRFQLGSPWGFCVPATDHATLLLVTRGRVFFELNGDEPQTFDLGPGDVVALPHGHAHTLRDDPATPVQEIGGVHSCRTALTEPRRGGQTELILLVCRFVGSPGNSLFDALPPLIHFAGDSGAAKGLEPALRLVALESASHEPGRATILDRLAEIVFVQVVRAWLEDETQCKGRLKALTDPRITPALSAIHDRPGEAWTVESLAGVAGMSRSSFATRFKELLGETPLDYLTRWRMQRAAWLLDAGETPLKQVVALSGYASEAAFRTAFRKWIGVSPGSYRSRRGADAATHATG
jgi:AraC-like DNA-binding protein